MNYLLWDLFGPASWPIWLLLVAAAATILCPRLVKPVLLVGALAAIILGVLPTGYWLMNGLEDAYPPAAPPAEVDHIVVLAGGEDMGAAELSGRIEFDCCGERVTEPVALARLFPDADLWAIGGYKAHPESPRDVDWMADYWRRAGVSPARIHIVGDTRDTCGNAQGIARDVPPGRTLLVTSAFHLPRAMACMKAAGRSVLPYGVDRRTWPADGIMGTFSTGFADNLARTELALHEYAGLAYYRLLGRID